jgi:Flp pilus assembly pilin Flp
MRILRFFVEQDGADLIEYTLLLAFICLVSAAFYIGVGNSTSAIWSITNARMSAAANAAANSS